MKKQKSVLQERISNYRITLKKQMANLLSGENVEGFSIGETTCLPYDVVSKDDVTFIFRALSYTKSEEMLEFISLLSTTPQAPILSHFEAGRRLQLCAELIKDIDAFLLHKEQLKEEEQHIYDDLEALKESI